MKFERPTRHEGNGVLQPPVAVGGSEESSQGGKGKERKEERKEKMEEKEKVIKVDNFNSPNNKEVNLKYNNNQRCRSWKPERKKKDNFPTINLLIKWKSQRTS